MTTLTTVLLKNVSRIVRTLNIFAFNTLGENFTKQTTYSPSNFVPLDTRSKFQSQ